MRKTSKIIAAGLAAATLATTLAAASGASADPRWARHGGYGYGYRGYHDHDRGGAALAAGIAGLALGAALAGGSTSYYAPAPRYYYAPRPAYAPVYVERYYEPGYYVPARPRVCAAWRHDYWGRPYRVTRWC